MACWYASAQMLIQWRRGATQSTEAGLPDPSEVPDLVNIYKANNGLPFARMIEFAQMMGLTPLPLMCPTPDAVAQWVQRYGPLWVAGYKVVSPTRRYGHVVVIRGASDDEFYVHDPEPVNVGTAEWKPADWLGSVLEIGVFNDVCVNFLNIS
jgi:hypothetical protein